MDTNIKELTIAELEALELEIRAFIKKVEERVR